MTDSKTAGAYVGRRQLSFGITSRREAYGVPSGAIAFTEHRGDEEFRFSAYP
jgi:hypothetical protein